MSKLPRAAHNNTVVSCSCHVLCLPYKELDLIYVLETHQCGIVCVVNVVLLEGLGPPWRRVHGVLNTFRP